MSLPSLGRTANCGLKRRRDVCRTGGVSDTWFCSLQTFVLISRARVVDWRGSRPSIYTHKTRHLLIPGEEESLLHVRAPGFKVCSSLRWRPL